MAILFWLLPTVVITAAASAWAAWMGRSRPTERSAEAQARAHDRMGAAIAKPHVTSHSPRRARESSTGVAVRRR